MTKPRQNYTTTSLDAKTTEAINNRTIDGETRSNRLARDINDYYALLEAGLRKARGILSPAEAMLIFDVQNGAYQAPAHWLGERLAHQVKDAISLDGLAEKHGVDGNMLIDKLERIGDMACVALTDWAAQVRAADNADFEEIITIFKG